MPIASANRQFIFSYLNKVVRKGIDFIFCNYKRTMNTYKRWWKTFFEVRNRMFLADEWTDPGLTEKRIHGLATYQYPASAMKAHPISKEFLKNEDPTEPFAYEILEELAYEGMSRILNLH
jgi:hypothetical protein